MWHCDVILLSVFVIYSLCHTMMSIVYLFIGIIFAAIHAQPKKPCPVSNKTDGKWYANCYNKNLLSVPKNLGKNLQILNISKNPFTRLHKSDLEPYPNLIELNMQSIKKVPFWEFRFDLLHPLKKLEILHISETEVQLPPMNLPPSIIKLYANRVPRTLAFIDFSVLIKLSHLELDNCSLHGMPVLHEEAPLMKIHVQNNFMNKLRYTDLAPYCLLKEFLLNITDLSLNHLFDHCCELLIWLEQHNVTNTVECKINSVVEPCNEAKYTPDPKASVAYDQCLIRNGLLYRFPYWILFAIFISCMVILVSGFTGYNLYQYYKSRKSAKE